jgi:hypothetical protein
MSHSPTFPVFRRQKDLAMMAEAHSKPELESAGARLASVDGLDLPKRRERSVNKSLRFPVSVLDELENICREERIEFSALVLFLVKSGLRGTFASAKNDVVQG